MNTEVCLKKSRFCCFLPQRQKKYVKNMFLEQVFRKLNCDIRFQRAFTACVRIFKVITLTWANQGNNFENANACSKHTLKTTFATQLKRRNLNARYIKYCSLTFGGWKKILDKKNICSVCSIKMKICHRNTITHFWCISKNWRTQNLIL